VNRCISPRRLALALALAVPFALAPSPCRADLLLPLDFASGAPTVAGSNGGLSYNATTHDLNATLTAPSLTYAAPFVNPGQGFAFITAPKLVIDLMVDNKGNFLGNGSVALTGTVTFKLADGGSVTFAGTTSANPLLSGTVTAFGADPAGPPSRTFDGYFTITGGALTQTQLDSKGNPVSGGFPLGDRGGFALFAENVTGGTLGDFTRNFSSSNDKPLVGVLVSGPSSLVLLLSAAVVLLRWWKPQLGRDLWARVPQPGPLAPLLTGTAALPARALARLRRCAALRRRTAPPHAG
jgi:hypothetical protein